MGALLKVKVDLSAFFLLKNSYVPSLRTLVNDFSRVPELDGFFLIADFNLLPLHI